MTGFEVIALYLCGVMTGISATLTFIYTRKK